MINSFKKIKENYPFFLLIIYIAGFLSWNYHLRSIGYYEYSIIDGRYIATGILFLLFSRVFFEFFRVFGSLKNELKSFFIFCIGFLFIFVPLIFPNIEQSFGGGRPTGAAIVSFDKNFLNSLGKIDIEVAGEEDRENSNQTVPLCLLYQNDNNFIFGVIKPEGENWFKQRVVLFEKSQIDMLQTRGGSVSLVEKFVCSWSKFNGL